MYKEKLYCTPIPAVDDLVSRSQIPGVEVQRLETPYLWYIYTFFKNGYSIKDHFKWLKDSIREIFLQVCQCRNAANSLNGAKIEFFRSLRNKIHKEVDKEKIDLKDLNWLTYNHLFNKNWK